MEFDVISPIDGHVITRLPYATHHDIARALTTARDSQRIWQTVALSERLALARQFVDHIASLKHEIAREITVQMGRPISQSPGEINGVIERANHMIAIAEQSLSDITIENSEHYHRFMRKVPLGVVFIIAPWNYPLLTAINALIPALLAGNSVIIKHASQTPLCGKRLVDSFRAVGLPEGVLQHLELTHQDTRRIIRNTGIDHVVFTGSTQAGQKIYQDTATRFINCTLELGGKDAAYVCQDADLDEALDHIVDGVYFNSGQSCCGIERIYVDQNIYDDFIAGFATRVEQYRLGNPLESSTNLGPMVSAKATEIIYQQVNDALQSGAETIIASHLFHQAKAGTPYCAPQALIGVDHDMAIMQQENFGPLVGIMPVNNEQQAIALINDSDYGLTASIWTTDDQRALRLAPKIQTGTVFMNRCDYLDPALAWTGVNNTGKGVSLSQFGFDQLTRLQSCHFKR